MSAGDSVAGLLAERAQPPLTAAGATLHWDGSGAGVSVRGAADGLGDHHAQPSPRPSREAGRQPTTGGRDGLHVVVRELGLDPPLPPHVIDWGQQATFVIFLLDPVFIGDVAPALIPGATGELVWIRREGQAEASLPPVHPTLIIHAVSSTSPPDCIELVPHLQAHDPLLHHIALVLQAESEAEGVAGRLYAEALTNALAVHFLRRYTACRQPVPACTGGLSPYKLRRTIAYIQGHLDGELSVAQLAAVGQTSPAHFARLFKDATGLTPHQYVMRCRIAGAKRLLAETELSLFEIGHRVGCADQSHFTTLFRRQVAMTPKAYRDSTKR